MELSIKVSYRRYSQTPKDGKDLERQNEGRRLFLVRDAHAQSPGDGGN